MWHRVGRGICTTRETQHSHFSNQRLFKISACQPSHFWRSGVCTLWWDASSFIREIAKNQRYEHTKSESFVSTVFVIFSNTIGICPNLVLQQKERGPGLVTQDHLQGCQCRRLWLKYMDSNYSQPVHLLITTININLVLVQTLFTISEKNHV